MRKSRYTDSQILAILKQNEEGAKVPDLCREHGMSAPMFYKWRAKFGGMDASLMKRMKELEDENRRLKKMYPEGIHMPRKSSKPERVNLIWSVSSEVNVDLLRSQQHVAWGS